MKLEHEYAIGLAFIVLVIVVAVVAMVIWGGKGSNRTAAAFRAACAEARGNAVWNGKYWECLR